MTPRVLVLEPSPSAPAGRLAQWWRDEGLHVDLLQPAAGDVVPVELEHDALVVMGGHMGANDDAEFPWLADIKRLLAHTGSAGVPTLGICLGHQLLAVAAGGRVRPHERGITAGLRRVGVCGSAASDPLLRDPRVRGGEGTGQVAVQWNNDVVVAMPPGATLLAAAPDGTPQAIRTGPRAWGVQFHPEATAQTVRVWAERDIAEGSLSTAAATQLLAEIERADALLTATWRPWAQRFAGVVARYAARQPVRV